MEPEGLSKKTEIMHKESYELMKGFARKYLDKNSKLKILDVGSCDVNGTYKDLFNNPDWKYIGLDIEAGPNVDIVSKTPYSFGLENESFDAIISGNCLEHVAAPWLWIKEIERVVKKKGIICITLPFNIREHRFPLDCYRIAPDGMRYLLEKAASFKVLECEIKEWKRVPNLRYGSMIADTYAVARRIK